MENQEIKDIMLKQLASGDYEYHFEKDPFGNFIRPIIIPSKFIEQVLIYHYRMPNTYLKYISIYYAVFGVAYWEMAFTGSYVDDPTLL